MQTASSFAVLEEKINNKTDKQSGCCTVDYKSNIQTMMDTTMTMGGNESTLKCSGTNKALHYYS
jgi:hypothetical protein